MHLFPAPVVGAPQDDGTITVAFGFMASDASEIALACRPCGEGMTRAQKIRLIVETFCHELGHYEQHREGKSLNERGIAQRTRRLLRLAEGRK